MDKKYKILKKPEDIICFADTISGHVDKNKKSFGFMPKNAYLNIILSGKIWVAVDNRNHYIGHIMFGGKPPYNIRVFQIFVIESFRRLKVAEALIKEIKEYAENQSCLTLEAHIADDLKKSIKFYESQGFYKNCDRDSSNTTGRNIVIYTCKLNTLSLFSEEEPFSILNTIKQRGQIGLTDRYVLDLNILFELIKKRDQSALIAEIFKSSFSGEYKLDITPEFIEELERHKKEEDPMFDIIRTLPVLKFVDEYKLIDIEKDLRKIIFPERSKRSKNAKNDASDLRHIAYCIHYGIPAFITLENKILSSAQEIYKKYSLQICSPIDLNTEINLFDYSSINKINKLIDIKNIILENNPNSLQIKEFLSQTLDLDKNILKFIKAYPSDDILDLNIAYLNKKPVALFLVGKQKRENILTGSILVSHDKINDLLSIIDHFLETFSRACQKIAPTEIELYSSNTSFLNELCARRGYILNKNYNGKQNLYNKLIAPLIVSQFNWLDFKKIFEDLSSAEISIEIPEYKEDKNGLPYIEIKDKGRYQKIDLFQLETLFSPSIFLFPKRNGVIIPIKKAYAEELISRSEDQLPFDINSEAFLKLEKAYFRSPKVNKSLFIVGTIVIFYESQGKRGTGRGAIGSARITTSNVVSVQEALGQYKRNGVLSEKELKEIASNNKIHVITFDNFKEFENPVSCKKLKEIGCGKAGFVAPERVKTSALSQIIYIGYDLPTKDIFISIKPEYVSKIISKNKTIELRRKPLLLFKNTKMWIYSTSPDQCIKAIAEIKNIHKGTPAEIWKKYGKKACISEDNFNDYFEGSEDAYAIELCNVKKISKDVKLSQIKKWDNEFTAPQFFRYLDHDSGVFDKLNKYLLSA